MVLGAVVDRLNGNRQLKQEGTPDGVNEAWGERDREKEGKEGYVPLISSSDCGDRLDGFRIP